ncbi:MAG TPA: hypothetical protein EYQ43_11800 [Methyloprofundus sp.]|nr:hypothetical protein [Methyloprofundus sp.]
MPTQREIASHLCLSVSRIQQLQYAGIIAKGANLDSARKAYFHWLRSQIKEKSTVNAERARLLHHQANLSAIEEENRRSKLIPADEVEEVWADISAVIKARLLCLSTEAVKVCTRIPDYDQMEHVFNRLVHDALDELANTSI